MEPARLRSDFCNFEDEGGSLMACAAEILRYVLPGRDGVRYLVHQILFWSSGQYLSRKDRFEAIVE